MTERIVKTNRHVLSVMVADRVGILRDITSAVADIGGNIDGITQTVVEGYFTVTLTATFPKGLGHEEIRHAVADRFSGDHASVVAIPYDERAVRSRRSVGTRHIITLRGKDQPGILKTVTAFLSEKKINIEDWYMRFSTDTVTHVGEVTIPPLLDIQQVLDEFRQRMAVHGITCSLQNINIFRAMNEIGPIKALISENNRAG